MHSIEIASNEFPQMKYSEQKGLISIIVTIYNTEENLLRECLGSILSQTFTNWEGILVNDGSTDNIGKIIDEYAKKDLRFIAIHKQNQGTLLARKTGLENSKGEFIANIDHDDTYNPQFLEKMLAKITETNADFVWCKCQIMDEYSSYCATDYKWNAKISENIKSMIAIKGTTWLAWNKLIKREIYIKVSFPNIHLTLGEDPVQILQVAYNSKSAEFVPENLYFHRYGGIATRFTKKTCISNSQVAIIINEILETIFNGAIPYNVKNAFYYRFKFVPYNYFSLSKKERQVFENELKPFLPEFIKHEKILRIKILCFLANIGIEFPFKFYQLVRNLYFVKWLRAKKINNVKEQYNDSYKR